jgi:MFS family permease
VRSGGRLLAFVSAIVFADTALYAVIAPLLPFYDAELGLTKTEAGILVAAYPAGVIVGSIPAGWLVARFGVRPITIAGLAVFGASSVAFGFAEDIALLDLSRFAQGLGSAASWTGGLAWLASATDPGRRGERLGTAFSAALAGALLGPALGAVAREAEPELVFAAAAAVSLALIVPAATLPVPARAAVEGGWLSALRNPALRPGTAVILVVGLFFGVVEVLVPLRLDALGAGAAAIAVAFAATSLLQALSGPAVGRVADRGGPGRPVAASLACGVVLAALLPLPEKAWLVAVLLALCGPLVGSLFVPGMKLLADGAERARLDQGYAFAVMNLAWALTMAGGSAAAGAIAEATSDAVAYLSLAGVMAAGLIACLGWARRGPGRPSSSGGSSPSSPSPSARTR